MAGTNNPAAAFRLDINGLRAWAVLAVLAYHFGIPGFGGGYAGVDVFFVISGFLMTGIVIGGLEKGDFSFWHFILARARRIVPALAFLCAALLALGWFFLSAIEYEALASEAASSLGFVSNVLFWGQAGYFDTAAHDKWLLHTWSLSLEWQFYVAYPLAIMFLWRFKPGRAAVASLLIYGALASAAVCVISTPLRQTDAFYLLPARAWEMLAGGLAYLHQDRIALSSRMRGGIELAGFGLIVGTLWWADRTTPWPGWAALAPVCGTALVLMAARTESMLSGTRVAQWLGNRSYSIYLWHWPVIVALGYLQLQKQWVAVCIGMSFAILIAHLSYRYVENAFHGRNAPMRRRPIIGASLFASVLLASACVIARDGMPERMPPAVEIAAKEAVNRYPKATDCQSFPGNPGSSCLYGGPDIGAILIGDSHADAVVSALAEAGRHQGKGVLLWNYPACPMLLTAKRVPGVLRSGEECSAFNRWAVAKLDDYPREIPIVLVSRTSVYAWGPNEAWETNANRPLLYFSEIRARADASFLHEFSESLTESACLLAQKRPVFLVRPIPEMGVNVPRTMSRFAALGYQTAPSVSLEEYRTRHEVVWKSQDNAQARCRVNILDPLPYLCSDGRCEGAAQGRPFYYDDNHLSEYGNKRLVPMFEKVFARH